MGIRQALEENKRIGLAITVAVVVCAGAFAIYQLNGMRAPRVSVPQYYYTDDDGKTLFSATGELVAPFDHGGKQAVRAYVYECSGKRFVGYLERYNDETKKMLLAAADAVRNAKPGDQAPPVIAQAAGAARGGREVKRPGDAKWVPAMSGEGGKITTVQTPPGSSGQPELVNP
jgi:hypothetical protein